LHARHPARAKGTSCIKQHSHGARLWTENPCDNVIEQWIIKPRAQLQFYFEQSVRRHTFRSFKRQQSSHWFAIFCQRFFISSRNVIKQPRQLRFDVV
jgi:hypothetical protein